jgi:hypothetical protein
LAQRGSSNRDNRLGRPWRLRQNQACSGAPPTTPAHYHLDFFILGLKAWPSIEYYDLIALAQHHGLSARLLDWSRRSYVAAYFAASDALSMDDAGELALWALDLGPGHFGMKNIHVVRVPGSNNA